MHVSSLFKSWKWLATFCKTLFEVVEYDCVMLYIFEILYIFNGYWQQHGLKFISNYFIRKVFVCMFYEEWYLQSVCVHGMYVTSKNCNSLLSTYDTEFLFFEHKMFFWILFSWDCENEELLTSCNVLWVFESYRWYVLQLHVKHWKLLFAFSISMEDTEIIIKLYSSIYFASIEITFSFIHM